MVRNSPRDITLQPSPTSKGNLSLRLNLGWIEVGSRNLSYPIRGLYADHLYLCRYLRYRRIYTSFIFRRGRAGIVFLTRMHGEFSLRMPSHASVAVILFEGRLLFSAEFLSRFVYLPRPAPPMPPMNWLARFCIAGSCIISLI